MALTVMVFGLIWERLKVYAISDDLRLYDTLCLNDQLFELSGVFFQQRVDTSFTVFQHLPGNSFISFLTVYPFTR